MNASIYRKTRFEIREIHQGPNSFGLVCTERGTMGRMPPLEVPEEAFSDKEMQQIHDVLQMLEERFEPVYDSHVNDPARLKELLVEAKAAEAALKVSTAEKTRLDKACAARAYELAKLDAEIAAKREAATET